MPHPYPRHVRFESSIQQIIAPQLLGLLRDGMITVTRVSVTPDLLEARVHYAVMGADGEDVQELLDGMAAPLRRTLARGLAAKRVPRLAFVADETGLPVSPCTDS